MPNLNATDNTLAELEASSMARNAPSANKATARFQRQETQPIPSHSNEAENLIEAQPVIERAKKRLRHANTVEESNTVSGADLFRNEAYEKKIADV